MNLKQLRDEVNRICDRLEKQRYGVNLGDYTVGIPAVHLGCIGGQPYVEVKSASLGFDWDEGKFFIWPETPIRATDRDEIQSLNKEINRLSFELLDLRNKIKKEK